MPVTTVNSAPGTLADVATQGDTFSAELAHLIDSLYLAIDNPKKIADSVAEFIKKNYPTRVQTAYWITLSHSHDRDKGVSVEIAQLPWLLQFRAVLGGWSGGFGVFTQPYDVTQLRAKFSIGAGAVIAYNHLSDLRPFIGFTVTL